MPVGICRDSLFHANLDGVSDRNKKRFPLVFRMGLILFGIFLVLLAEGLLRILTPPAPACKEDPFVGFAGKETLFIKTAKQGKYLYEINPRIAKFFNRQTFPAKKSENTFRIFVLGGSVAMGFPFLEPGSFSRFLETGLSGIEPSMNFEVINAGGFGYASYRVVRILREVVNYDPDLIVVMSGHNEFLEKRTYGEIQEQSPALVAVRTRLSELRVYCLLKTLVFKSRGPEAGPLINADVTWEKYVRDPVQMSRTLEHYKYNLEEMAKICRRENAPLVLLTLPCNLLDFAPYRSEHSGGLKESDLDEWHRSYSKALESLAFREYDKALGYLTIASKKDPEYAELHFLTGRILWRKKQWDQAREKFWLAVRFDAWPIRAFDEMNRMVINLAQEQGVLLAEAEREFSEGSVGAIPGDDWFLDHCHPGLEGNRTIGRSVITAILKAGIIKAAPEWQDAYEKACKEYVAGLPDYLLAEAYYRAAFETGLNLRRIDRGLALARKANGLDPQNPKISNLISTLTDLKGNSSWEQ